MRRQEPDAVGYDVRFTFLENFDSTYYFSKIMTNQIYKKFCDAPPVPPAAARRCMRPITVAHGCFF
jgi:hypothetical protein